MPPMSAIIFAPICSASAPMSFRFLANHAILKSLNDEEIGRLPTRMCRRRSHFDINIILTISREGCHCLHQHLSRMRILFYCRLKSCTAYVRPLASTYYEFTRCEMLGSSRIVARYIPGQASPTSRNVSRIASRRRISLRRQVDFFFP